MLRVPIDRMLVAVAALLAPAAACAVPAPFAYSFAPIPGPEAAVAKHPAITALYTAKYRACLNDPKSTTYSMDMCDQAEMIAQDAALNRQWIVRFTSFPAAGKPALRQAQRTWIAARKAYCDKWSNDYQGGTIMPLIYGGCYVDETIRRTLWLAALRP